MANIHERMISRAGRLASGLTASLGNLWAAPSMSSELRRSRDDDAFLRAVRGHRFDGSSDSELRDALAAMASSPDRDIGGTALVRVFAIVDEAISRRLGAWRVFAADLKEGPLAQYRALADSLVRAAPYKSQVAYYADETFLESPAFRRSLEPLLGEMGLDDDGLAVVAAMVYVAEAGKLRYEADIPLQAEFYRALRRQDTERAAWFRATDEQLLAGRLLCANNVVEMSAGEGKTLAAAFPAVLHALRGRSVHVITANDYLASRDADWLAPVYEALGLSVRAVLSHMGDADKREAYRAQVVYGSLREFGFDFLRDNMRHSANELVQRRLDVAIVDEADLALIDESRTPLIISGAPSSSGRSVHRAKAAVDRMIERQRRVVSELEPACDDTGLDSKARTRLLAKLTLADPENAYLVRTLAGDSRLRRRVQSAVSAFQPQGASHDLADDLYYAVETVRDTVTATERGQGLLERYLGPIYDTGSLEQELALTDARRDLTLAERRKESDRLQREISRWHNQMNQVHQMLRASLVLRRDEDYIVADGQVVLIDSLTGRRRPDSRYQHGLHAALEAKEGVAVSPDSEVLAQISVQGFVGRYQRLSGMTGTAETSADEFRRAYGLDVVEVPPFKPSKRTDLPARLYSSLDDKLTAVLAEVESCRRVGRPVLVAALTVDQSTEISRLLDRHGIAHHLLNAVTNAQEADVVRSAGRFGAVTVSTNMAGRGTDVVLEPGLDEQVVSRYMVLVNGLLSDSAGRVELSCASPDLADVFEAALRESAGLAVSRAKSRGSAGLTVTAIHHRDSDKRTVCFEAGLGLHVVGTEMNESRRVDAQLKGRGGRQGEFGSSRSIVSLEDSPIFSQASALPDVGTQGKRQTTARGYLEGRVTDRFLRRAQSSLEMDDEADRSASVDYSKVLERQTLGYYGLRKQILGNDSFDPVGAEVIEGWVTRLLRRHLPISMMDRYADRFDSMAEELWLDYGLDIASLWGLGVEALGRELVTLMASRVEGLRLKFGRNGADDSEKLLYLQTSDELWTAHCSRLHELMLSGQLCATGHVAATYRYLFHCIEEADQLRDDVVDVFVPRLFAYLTTGSVGAAGPEDEILIENVHEILV